MQTDAIFRNRKLNLQKLLDYGFIVQTDSYCCSTGLLDGQFEMTVNITATGHVTARVFDTAAKEEYVLHQISGSTGAFVGSVREEYEQVLRSIAENCFDMDAFQSDYASRVIQYVRDTYQRELEYLWEKFPNNAIWRRADNEKWFGALLTVSKKKLGLDSEELVEIIDLRIAPETLPSIVDGVRYFPGYHMNKKHWFTICLDGSVPIEEICHWIDLSYQIAAKK